MVLEIPKYQGLRKDKIVLPAFTPRLLPAETAVFFINDVLSLIPLFLASFTELSVEALSTTIL